MSRQPDDYVTASKRENAGAGDAVEGYPRPRQTWKNYDYTFDVTDRNVASMASNYRHIYSPWDMVNTDSSAPGNV